MQKQGSALDESKAFLFSKISHELKSPIHGISGLAKFLDENWHSLDDEVRRRYTHDISSASNVLNDLMESLLGFFRFDLKAIDFKFAEADLLDEAIIAIERSKLFLNPAKKHLTIELEASLKSAKAKIDKFWFKQLLNNLLTNAINYSDKGAITVNIQQGQNGSGSDYIICVRDQGAGIKDSELENIFKAFNQGQGEVESAFKSGFGLGLAICREVVSAHGGKIWAQNNEDRGAAIFFSIPEK